MEWDLLDTNVSRVHRGDDERRVVMCLVDNDCIIVVIGAQAELLPCQRFVRWRSITVDLMVTIYQLLGSLGEIEDRCGDASGCEIQRGQVPRETSGTSSRPGVSYLDPVASH